MSRGKGGDAVPGVRVQCMVLRGDSVVLSSDLVTGRAAGSSGLYRTGHKSRLLRQLVVPADR